MRTCQPIEHPFLGGRGEPVEIQRHFQLQRILMTQEPVDFPRGCNEWRVIQPEIRK
jgi:hypothetical protein